jgi:hypothetical protein
VKIEYIILALFALVALTLDGKKGIYFIIIAGFIQDPIRKLVEGIPVILTTISAVSLFAVYLRSRTRIKKIPSILALYPQLRNPLSFFFFIVIMQTLNTYINTLSIKIAAIGLLAYLSPIPAIVFFYEVAESFNTLRKILTFYIAITFIFMASLWVEWYGVDWRALGTFGKEWFAYYGGLSVRMMSGLFRSPEVAAWHGATAGILALALSFGKGRKLEKWNLLMFIVFFSALFLTGRRKAIGTVLIFIGVYTLYLFLFRLSGKRRFVLLLLTVIVLFSGLYFVSDLTPESSMNYPLSPYFLRGKSTFEGTPTRLNTILGNVTYTFREAGFFGLGTGYFSQGTQYVLEFETKKAKYTEVGPAKILGEIGIPGVIVILWLGVTWYKGLRKRLGDVSSQGGRRYAALLISLLLANIAAFFTSALVFGDPFVLIIMGMMVGMLMAIPKIESYSCSAQKSFGGDAKLYLYKTR